MACQGESVDLDVEDLRDDQLVVEKVEQDDGPVQGGPEQGQGDEDENLKAGTSEGDREPGDADEEDAQVEGGDVPDQAQRRKTHS